MPYIKKEVIFISILIGCVFCILFSSVPVFSDQVITI